MHQGSYNKTIVNDRGKLGNENGPARSEFCGDSATLKHTLSRVKQELRSQHSRTPIDTIWNPTGSWSGFFLCSHHFIKFTVDIFPQDIVRSFLDVFENGLVAMVPLAVGARLKKARSNKCITSCLTRLHPQGDDRLPQCLHGDRASVSWSRRG